MLFRCSQAGLDVPMDDGHKKKPNRFLHLYEVGTAVDGEEENNRSNNSGS